MTRPSEFLSEIVQARIVELLRTEPEAPTLRQIAEKLELEPVAVTVNLGKLQSAEEVRAYVDREDRTRFDFAPHQE